MQKIVTSMLIACVFAGGCSKAENEAVNASRGEAARKTLARIDARSQQKKQVAIDVIQGRVAPPPIKNGACPPPFYGIESGDRITVEKSEQQLFGLPPGIYAFNDTCTPSLTRDAEQYPAAVREESYKQAEQKLKTLQAAFSETLKKTLLGQDPVKTAADQNGKCPAPHQQFSPGQFVVVRSAQALASVALPVPGSWYFDVNCKPNWVGPMRFTEPSDIQAGIDRENFNKQMGAFIFASIVVIALFVFVARITKRTTGRSLLEWLRGTAR